MQRLVAIRQMAGNDPQAAFQEMMRTNPQFQRFMADNRGKTPQQVAREHGIDLAQVSRMIGA